MFIKILSIASVLFFTSCAVSHQKMQESIVGFEVPHSPQKDNAVVYIIRPDGTGDLIRFNVFLDDKEKTSEMGYTRAGQYIYFNVKPGTHNIFSKAENWAEAIIDAKGGDVMFIAQDPSMGFIMARNSLRIVDEVEGKYYLKKGLTPGTIIKTEKTVK